MPQCDWSDPDTGECCVRLGPFGFGPPKITTTIHACSSHRDWAEQVFEERKRAEK